MLLIFLAALYINYRLGSEGFAVDNTTFTLIFGGVVIGSGLIFLIVTALGSGQK